MNPEDEAEYIRYARMLTSFAEQLYDAATQKKSRADRMAAIFLVNEALDGVVRVEKRYDPKQAA